MDHGKMSSPSFPSSLILPVDSRPRPKTQVSDTRPVLWKATKENAQTFQRASRMEPEQCSVCHQHEARYTCPKCETPYCSITCYRDHSSGTGENSCTESFYQNRVSQVLELELKDKQQGTQRMLNRAHHHQQQQDDIDEMIDMTEEELYRLLNIVEGGDEQEIAKVLTDSRLKAALERSIENGELNDWILDPWHPWWRPEIVSQECEIEQDNYDDVADETSKVSNEKTLDERLLEVPPLKSLRPGGKEVPDLSSNLVDILYSIVCTLRLYHGVANAMEVGVDAAEALIASSHVLSQDARYERLEEALKVNTELSTRSLQSGSGCNTSWKVLAQDVALVCRNHRFVGRALLEADDVIRNAISVLKKHDPDSAKTMRRISKKLEFYLSWSRANASLVELLADNIEAWIADWKAAPGDSAEEGDATSNILLPLSGTASSWKLQSLSTEPSLLIQEVSSKRNPN